MEQVRVALNEATQLGCDDILVLIGKGNGGLPLLRAPESVVARAQILQRLVQHECVGYQLGGLASQLAIRDVQVVERDRALEEGRQRVDRGKAEGVTA